MLATIRQGLSDIQGHRGMPRRVAIARCLLIIWLPTRAAVPHTPLWGCSQPSSYLQLGPLFGLNIEWLSYGATGGVSQSHWMLYTLQGKLCHTWCLEASERHHCHRYIDGERPFQRVRKQPAYGTVAINWHSRAASLVCGRYGAGLLVGQRPSPRYPFLTTFW